MSGLLTNNAILKLADFLCLLGQLEGSKTPTECPRRGVVGGGMRLRAVSISFSTSASSRYSLGR
jgi:hypothetical protein